MIILEANVLSALMRREPDAAVVAWLDGQAASSVDDGRNGFRDLVRAPPYWTGQARRVLELAFVAPLREEVGGRVLAFDRPAAEATAGIAAARRAAGRPVDIRDLQIAGIATARRGALATRNIRDVEGTGITLVDPWTSGLPGE